MVMGYLDQIKDAIINGKYKEIEGMVSQLIKDGVDLKQLIDEGMIAAMDGISGRDVYNRFH